jgi:hypothetical protein
MKWNLGQRVSFRSILLMVVALGTLVCPAQQIIQRGAFGKPSQVLDETQQWTTPLLLSSDRDVELYIPDISNPEWLARNYQSFQDKGQFVLSMFTFYKNPQACRTNQVAWGFSDGASGRLQQYRVQITSCHGRYTAEVSYAHHRRHGYSGRCDPARLHPGSTRHQELGGPRP